MYDLSQFSLSQMITCGAELRGLNTDAQSMEEAANRIVRYLYSQFKDPEDDTSACSLVRFYKTHPYRDLPSDLQTFARSILKGEPESPAIKCLTLMATAGDRLEWNDRRQSSGHQAIPLPSPHVVNQLPMIAQLVRQFGLEINSVLQPEPDLLVDIEQQAYNVFYVEDAAGSPYIPAQEAFVLPCGIKSVVGFGGMLQSGDLFAVIMFSKILIPSETAELFKTLSLSVKMAVLPYAGDEVFAQGERHERDEP